TGRTKNVAGARFDFGSYGANLMTWLMDNQRHVTVTAITQRIKPEVYPRVDDEATILLEYPKAQGIIQASWNWPFNRKDFEVYGEGGYAIATGGNAVRVRLPGKREEARTPEPLPTDEHRAAKPQTKNLAIFRVFVVKPSPNPPRRHEDAKNHEGFSISRKVLSSLRRTFGLVLQIRVHLWFPSYFWLRLGCSVKPCG